MSISLATSPNPSPWNRGLGPNGYRLTSISTATGETEAKCHDGIQRGFFPGLAGLDPLDRSLHRFFYRSVAQRMRNSTGSES